MTNGKVAYSISEDLNSKTDDELVMLAREKNEEAEEALKIFEKLIESCVNGCQCQWGRRN